jgi:hypothetical protein
VNARNDRPDALQVRIPAPPPGVVGVADHVSIVRPFAAKFTLHCHIDFLHSKRLKSKVLIVAEARQITKQLGGEGNLLFSWPLKLSKALARELKGPSIAAFVILIQLSRKS